MKEVYKNLFIGSKYDCDKFIDNENYAILHACKTCHREILEDISKDDKFYFMYKKDNDNIYLNIVDMNEELSKIYTESIIKEIMSFINSHIKNKKVLVHCDLGVSRSASVVLIYLAKEGIINNKNFNSALHDFESIYKSYSPSYGFYSYLDSNWDILMQI